MFPNQHGNAVSFLAGGTRGGPNREPLCAGALLQQPRQNVPPKRLERVVVPEEQGFIGGECFDGPVVDAVDFEFAAELPDEIRQRTKTLPLGNRGKPGLDQIFLPGLEHDCRLVEREVSDILEILF